MLETRGLGPGFGAPSHTFLPVDLQNLFAEIDNGITMRWFTATQPGPFVNRMAQILLDHPE